MSRSLLLFLLLSALLWSESRIKTELEIYNYFIRADKSDWQYYFRGDADLSVASKGNRNVKGELALRIGSAPDIMYGYGELVVTNIGGITMTNIVVRSAQSFDTIVRKLNVKVRFPVFHLNMGKTRIGWGEGVLFNAGDVLFGSDDVNVDLAAEEIREDTAWLSSIFIPAGNFAFFELVAKAPPLESMYKLKDSSAGFRFYATPGRWKTELGYLFDGIDGGAHNPYISFKVNVEADIYMSSSISIPKMGGDFAAWNDSWQISIGSSYIFDLPTDHSLTLMLESLFVPFGRWNDKQSFRTVYDPYSYEVTSIGAKPGVLLYPSLTWGTGTTGFSLTWSAIISPLDRSIQNVLFAGWSVYQGLTFIGSFTLGSGSQQDLFGFNRQGGLAAGLGVRYKF